MAAKKLVTGVLVILLLAGFAGVFAAAPVAGRGLQALAQAVPDWQQVNSNGFGDLQNIEVTALEAFNGYLYAGTHNPINPEPLYDGAQIFRSSNGITWTAVTQPGFGNTHDTAPSAILDMTIFNGYLYASTGRSNNEAQIWRLPPGGSWQRVVNAGFGNPNIFDMTVLTEYGGYLYVGATIQDSAAQIWRSSFGDGNLNYWTPVATGTVPASITSFAVYSSGLYAAIQSEADAPAEIWRSDGGLTWTSVMTDGFGVSNTTLTGGMAEFGGYLYVGAGNTADGAQLWRTNNPDSSASWTQVITPAFGNANNQKVESVFVFQNQLYASVNNTATGLQVWRSANGTDWERANQDGFGDSRNSGSNWSNATADFLGQLYVGTSNVVDGGELWRMVQPVQVNFSGIPTSGVAPLTVNFSNLSSGNYDTCAWTFGDGGGSNSCGNPSHEYSAAGVYTVSLTAGGLGGSDTLTRTNYVAVSEPALAANFTASPLAGRLPLTVVFTNTSTGLIDTWQWNFGDAVTNTLENPSHTYTVAGIYTVTLTVNGPDGSDTLTKTNSITVTNPQDIFLPIILKGH